MGLDGLDRHVQRGGDLAVRHSSVIGMDLSDRFEPARPRDAPRAAETTDQGAGGRRS
jgi:hypothetical protein